MPIDDIPNDPWRRLVEELQGSREAERQPWGEIDDLTIARFLTGECDEEERALVENASRQFPELKECITLAGEALNDVNSPVPASKEEGAVGVATVDVAPRGNRVSIGRRVWRMASAGAVPNWAAAACLLIAVGLGWALMARLDRLNSKLVALQTGKESSEKTRPAAGANAEVQALRRQCDELIAQRDDFRAKIADLSQPSHADAPAVTEASETPSGKRNREQVATAIRGVTGTTTHTRLLTMAYTCYRPSEETPNESRTQAGKPAGYHSVRETGAIEGEATLSHDIVDNPPTLPMDELLPALSNKSNLVRWAAADVLSRIADGTSKAKARTAVIEMLKKRDDQGRAAADYVLNGRIAEGFGTDLSQSAMAALASPDKIVRWAGLHYFLVVRRCFEDKGQVVSSPTYFPADFVARLVDQLVRITRQKDETLLLSKAAVYLLGQFGNQAKPALNDLVEILESDGDPQTRRWAAYAIGQIGPAAKAVAPRLGRLLLKEASRPDGKIDETVFPAVAYAYGELYSGEEESSETKKVAVTLIDCLGNASPNISYWSAYALWKINDPAPHIYPGGESSCYSTAPPALSSPAPPTSAPAYTSPAPGYSVPPLPSYSPPPGYSPSPITVAKPPTPASGSGGGSDSSRDARKTDSTPDDTETQPVRPVPTPAPPEKIDVGGWRPSRD